MQRRGSGDDTASTDNSSATSSQPSIDDDDKAERPTLRRRSPEDIKNDKQKKKNDVATVTSAGSLNDDPDRPTLKHSSRSTDGDTDMPKLLGVPPDMKQMVAVSDAKNRDPHPFARPWEDVAEHATILAKMQAFARAKLTEYGIVPGVTPPQAPPSTTVTGAKTATPGSTNTPAPNEGPAPPKLKRGIPTDDTTTGLPASAPAAAKPAAPTSASTEPAAPKLKRGVPTDDTTTASTAKSVPASPAAKKSTTTANTRSKMHRGPAGPSQVVFADEVLKGYLLSYGGAPTYVYTTHTVETGSVMRYVTVVAQDDGMGHLKVALASATDAAHLDRTPWMRLVDAVDVEASNRASLLFELRGQSSRQFALYRVIAAKPEQIFMTASGF
jgi:hypothetical protein